MRVFIVSFAPANDYAGVGGFNWFRLYDLATENYRDESKASEISGGSHIVRLLVSPELDMSLGDDDITRWIDNDLDRWEFSETPIMQYIPPNTAPDRLPLASK